MRPVYQLLGESFIYACAFDEAFTYDQFVPEHLLAYQIFAELAFSQKMIKIIFQ